MASVWDLQCRSFSIKPSIWVSGHQFFANAVEFRREFGKMRLSCKIGLRAIGNSVNSPEASRPKDVEEMVKIKSDSAMDYKDHISRFQGMIASLPPVVFAMRRHVGSNFMIWVSVATAFFIIAARVYVVRKSRQNRPGSVADLVRRGQLRSDRGGISRPLKYEDPFNNPLVKVGKSNSTVEMCGKLYKLAPVTLTEEQQAIHQKRRSRAYQWKRPTLFLKEGDSIPPDTDPDTVRWIPANHPFATTASEIDEDLAQNNVYQKHGVPFRIQAEHEALQRKLEALQNEQKLNKLFIDTGNATDFERSFKLNSKLSEIPDQSPFNNQVGESKAGISDPAPDSYNSSSSSSEEVQEP
ncbi:hypothetical protein K2173_027966 [Erythroxylum novogranatense]|uniref:Protein MULTIPLE CHLOROPLAST DIVISION SITE 1 n=1 Tax=Erythroxylum novogranatense TaxID=1862640 RepID=A0AAV8U3H1_9ROSI|nr:hypothetical protein K2173_027966 [Erythroxylum novogranatense]